MAVCSEDSLAAAQGAATVCAVEIAAADELERGEASSPELQCPDGLEGPSNALDADADAVKDGASSGAQARDLRWRRPLQLARKVGLPVVLLLVGLCVLLWPKDPVWDLHQLNMDPDTLNSFISVTTGATNSSDILSFSASVDVYNPNFVGTRVDAGSFNLFYRGSAMGSGTFGEIKVGPRESIQVKVNIDMALTPAVGHRIMTDAMENSFKIYADADVRADAHVGLLTIKAHITCNVEAITLKMLEDPNQVLGEKKCSYHYAPW